MRSSASILIQSVPTGFNPEKFTTPFGTLPCFCSETNFSLKIFLCFKHETPIMYSCLSTVTEITNSGGLTQSFPFSLIEHLSGSN